MLLTLLPEGNPLGAVGVLTFAGALFITVFEVFVAVLQAFIFTLLSSIYLNFSLEESH
jgi:F-type H+-transporting ATPase subunit a